MSSDRFTEHYRLLSTDPQMRAQLLADPKAALAAYFGAVIDGDYRIEVIEQRPDTITAVIPTPPEPTTDRAARLADVSGAELRHPAHQRDRLPHTQRVAHLGAS